MKTTENFDVLIFAAAILLIALFLTGCETVSKTVSEIDADTWKAIGESLLDLFKEKAPQ